MNYEMYALNLKFLAESPSTSLHLYCHPYFQCVSYKYLQWYFEYFHISIFSLKISDIYRIYIDDIPYQPCSEQCERLMFGKSTLLLRHCGQVVSTTSEFAVHRLYNSLYRQLSWRDITLFQLLILTYSGHVPRHRHLVSPIRFR